MFADHLKNFPRIKVIHDDLGCADSHQRKGEGACGMAWALTQSGFTQDLMQVVGLLQWIPGW